MKGYRKQRINFKSELVRNVIVYTKNFIYHTTVAQEVPTFNKNRSKKLLDCKVI
jgi:hypothetical protein